MFYFPDVLQRHTGKFSTIWLVATKAGKVTKRDYLKVNVVRTCEEIIRYIVVQVRPPYPSTSRPRFSLYLSAQLEIGVVRVFHRQCNYLIEEIQHILDRIHRTYSQGRINMPDFEQPNLLLTDMVSLMDTYEGALDPFFGVMASPPLPTPSLIPQMKPLLQPPSPGSPREDSPRGKGPSPALTVSPELITLREVEPILMPEVEAGPDLPEPSPRELQDFLAGEYRFPEESGGVDPRVPRKRARREEVPRELDRGVGSEPEGRSLASPVRVPGEEEPLVGEADLAGVPTEFTTIHPGEDAPDKEVEFPAPPSLPPSPREELPTFQELPSIPELVLPEIPERRLVPRQRRRRLPFIDPVVQVPREEILEQIQSVDIHCVPARPIDLPRQRRIPPATLFLNPSYERWMPPELQIPWNRCTHIEPVDYSARRTLEATEIEALRETLEANIPQLTLTGSLEESESETSRSLSKTSEDIRPPTAEMEEKLATVMEVSETLEDSPVRLPSPPDTATASYRSVMDLVSRTLADRDETDLHLIFPRGATRIHICRIFYICLVLASRQVLYLDQSRPYGSIAIGPGPRFNAGL